MVPSIEVQIHQFLKDKEEERCKALEEEYYRKTGTFKKINRKIINMPKVRLGESAICQEPDLLIMIDEYDYDLSNEAFQKYCMERGVFHVAGSEGSKRREYLQDYNKDYSEFLNEHIFWPQNWQHPLKDNKALEYMETQWKIIRLGRGKLQDCWELYSKKVI